MNKKFIFPQLAAPSTELTETLDLGYIKKEGLWVVEEHIVPVRIPTIRLQRELDKAIELSLESLKGRLINTRV